MRLRKRTKSAIMGVVAVLVLVFGCPGAIIVAADLACNASIEEWIPLYPGAEVIETQYNLLRPRGIGLTSMVLRTQDDAETVRQWYRDNVIQIMHRGGGNRFATTSWQVEESQDGILIRLYSECGFY